MTAGKGIVHGENFPLVNKDKPNHTRFFQLWLNLPKKSKMVDPCFVMHWAETIPILRSKDGLTKINLFAGKLTLPEFTVTYKQKSATNNKQEEQCATQESTDTATIEKSVFSALAPPPSSYASVEDNDVGIYYIQLQPNGRFVLPAAVGGSSVNRMAYYVECRILHITR